MVKEKILAITVSILSIIGYFVIFAIALKMI